jgi:hypothetical protein
MQQGCKEVFREIAGRYSVDSESKDWMKKIARRPRSDPNIDDE